MERKTWRLAGAGANGRIARAAWLATTALTAILMSPGALRAQSALPPTTTPQGGVVVGGSATITQGAASTTINQSSQLTAINWRSFNVGSAASVQFNQPSSSAIALNRVVTPEPSVIAGKINANGQIVLVNQSGVVFTKGAQVNAESIVVSTSNVATKDFMAGKLVFSGAPNPGAKIINNGALTARQAGLVGLVAPQVANNGVITAQLGRVVLAGASAFTLDLYGDRLVSLDVTQAVRAVDVGGKLVPALVTNSGLILADGGKVTLTARDADALVTQLINAGGTIRANTVGANTGTISIQGVGGDIQIAGNLLAQGTQAGSKGGAVEALTTGTVSVAPGAVINAAGDAGGGVVALGTNLQRAAAGAADTAAPRAAAVVVAAGAVVKADATGSGNGGRVTLLSSRATNFAGAISAQGGPQGGNGGMVEISSDGVISLGGTVVDTALNGQPGEILLDPQTLIVSSSGTSSGQTSYIDPASLVSLTGSVTLSAAKLVDVVSAVNLTGASVLTLSSGGDVTIGASIDTVGSLEIDAGGTLLVGAGLTAGSIALLDTGAKTLIDIGAPVVGTTLVALESGGGISEIAGGVISTASLVSGAANSGNDMLGGANSVTTLGAFTLGGAGTLTFADAGALNVAGTVSAADVILESSGAVSEVSGGALNVGTLSSGGTTIGGAVSLGNGNDIGTLGAFAAAGTILLDDSGALNIAGVVQTPGQFTLRDGGAVSEVSGGVLNVGTLSSGGTTIGGDVLLTNFNGIGTLGNLLAAGKLVLDNAGSLTVAGPVQANAVTLVDNGTVILGGLLQATGGQAVLVADGLLEATGGAVSVGSGGTIAIAPYTGGGVVDVGGTAAGGLELSSLLLSGLDPAGSVVIGSAGSFGAGSIYTEGLLLLSNPLLVLDAAGQITQTGILIGNVVDMNASNLALDGGLEANAFNIVSRGGVSQPSTGELHVGTLSSGGTTIGGDVALNGSLNSVLTLGAFAAAGNFSLVDAAPLAVAGPVSATNISLSDGSGSASSLAINGTLAAGSGGTISLIANSITSSGANLVAPGGTVAIAPYTSGTAIDLGGTAAGLDLGGALLDAVSGSTSLVDINTTGSIATDGAVSVAAGALLLSGNGVRFNGTLAVPGALELASTNGVTTAIGESLSAGTLLAGGAINGPVNMALGNNAIGTLGAFSLPGRDLALTSQTPLLVRGALNAGNITLNANGLTLASVISAASAVTLDSAAGVVESGGAIDAPSLTTGGATIVGAALLGGANTIGTLGGFMASGDVLVNDNGPLSVAGAAGAANITLAAAGLSFAGDVTTPGLLALASTGGVTQTAGTISAATLNSNGGTIAGGVDLAQAGDALRTIAGFAATGGITVADATPLSVAGPFSATNITQSAAGIAVDGRISTGTLQLASSAGVSEGAGGQVAAAALTTGGATITGDAVLNMAGNLVNTLGAFAATGGLTLSNATDLMLAAPVSLGGTLALLDTGNITQSGTGITAAALTSDGGTIGGNALFGGAGNVIPVLGAFAAGGNVLLNDTGAISLEGNISAGNMLSLDGGGAITQGSGIVSAALLNANAVSLTLPDANLIGGLGSVTVSGDISAAGVGGIAGPVRANSATLSATGNFTATGNAQITNALYITVGGNLTQSAGSLSAQTATLSAGGGMSLSGTTAIANEVDLIAASSITHAAGSLSAATLAGSAGTLASFGAYTNIGTLGSFIMHDSLFALANAGALTIVGPVAANTVNITAQGPITLAGSATGGLFITGTLASSAVTAPSPVDSVISAAGSAAAILQTGTFLVNSGANALTYLNTANQPATLFLYTQPSGIMNFAANTSGSLYAPSVALVLAAGPAGVVTGNVNLRQLEVLSALSVNLNGTIAGIPGPTAAGGGTAFPFPQPSYRFNTCPIGSVNCTILPIEILPEGNPLENFDISPRKRKRLDHGVQLPGIATRDF